MPGIGGLQINRAGYFLNYGPGHYDMTFVMGQNGLNEDEFHILNHLVHYKRSLFFIRSKSDSTLTGLEESIDTTREEALKYLVDTTKNYIKSHVKESIEIFFIGLPSKQFPDYQTILEKVKNGEQWQPAIDNNQKYLLTIKREFNENSGGNSLDLIRQTDTDQTIVQDLPQPSWPTATYGIVVENLAASTTLDEFSALFQERVQNLADNVRPGFGKITIFVIRIRIFGSTLPNPGLSPNFSFCYRISALAIFST